MDTSNLTPTLNDSQLRGNIDALQKGGLTNDKVQAYVDNYQKGADGNYTLKTQNSSSDNIGNFGGKPIVGGIVGKTLNDFNQRGQNIQADIQNGIPDKNAGMVERVAKVGSTLGHMAGEVAGGVGDIIGNVISPLLPEGMKQRFGEAATKLNGQIDSIPGMTPEIKKSLGDVFNTVSLLGGEKAAPKVTEIAGDAKNMIGDAKDTVMGKIKGTPTDPVQASIEAVNPDLSGKNLTSAYKQVVTGNRETIPSSIFQEQGLTPNEQTTNLGTRLSDLGLGKDPVKNLDILKTALNDTETKVTAALKGDPEINYNAQKPDLFKKLNDLKTTMPREFSTIKDSTKAFSDVTDFAKQVVTKSEDSITGLRDARSEFDAQARKEYPSAFKDGKIDTKTPAGSAIKGVRDTINEHLYNTAPNGSEIQKLIGREADIYRATDNIAPKASAGHGENIITKTVKAVKNHPVISAGLGVEGARKAVTGHF